MCIFINNQAFLGSGLAVRIKDPGEKLKIIMDSIFNRNGCDDDESIDHNKARSRRCSTSQPEKNTLIFAIPLPNSTHTPPPLPYPTRALP